ncbi:MAG: TlyA family RNA methyltransferase [Candidatus Aminicenantales bacterium]
MDKENLRTDRKLFRNGHLSAAARPKKERIDKLLVERGLAESRHKAQALIMAGLVFSGQEKLAKPGQKIDALQDIQVKKTMPYVSRGGLKLEEALMAFQVSVRGKIAADLGASTGGFTDCLLQRGARWVYAVDVDTSQLDWRLRREPRVRLIEKNARYLKKSDFEHKIDVVTLDLSFISVLKVLPAIKDFLGRGSLLALLKPQFEVGRRQVGKGGIVRNPELHQQVLTLIIEAATQLGFSLKGLIKPSVKGQKGNQEFFVHWTLAKQNWSSQRLAGLIKEVVWNEKN